MNNYKHVLTTKDFLVTGDKFDISKNLKTGILETHPKPSRHDLHKYYDSKDYMSHSQKPSSFFSFCYRQIRAISTKRKLNFNFIFEKPTYHDIDLNIIPWFFSYNTF